MQGQLTDRHVRVRSALLEELDEPWVHEHLAGCPSCASYATTLRAVDNLAPSIDTPAVPQRLIDIVLPDGVSDQEIADILDAHGLFEEAKPWLQGVMAAHRALRRGLMEAGGTDSMHALSRLDAGAYGECEDCCSPISRTILRSKPQTTRCESCARRVRMDLERMAKEVSERLAQRVSSNRVQVERALGRLAEGKYGVCEDCGARIPTERLRFRPEATRCVDCQGGHDRLNQQTA